jgi:RHS repeat-associated protein
MKTKLNIMMLAFVAVSVNLHAVPQAPPAPLPQFMNKEQLTQWSASQSAAAKVASSSQDTSTQFYTGKPYVADAGGYVFKYRTYNPEMSRWTSADPSGFPDGVNNFTYAAVPVIDLDTDGLRLVQGTSSATPSITSSDFIDAALQALDQMTTLPSAIINYITGLIDSRAPRLASHIRTATKGTANYDDSSESWSNPGIVAAGPTGLKINLNGTVSGVGITGSIQYSIAYTLSGSADFTNQNASSATVEGNFVPTLTATLAGNMTPGGGLEGTGSALASAFTADVTLNE